MNYFELFNNMIISLNLLLLLLHTYVWHLQKMYTARHTWWIIVISSCHFPAPCGTIELLIIEHFTYLIVDTFTLTFILLKIGTLSNTCSSPPGTHPNPSLSLVASSDPPLLPHPSLPPLILLCQALFLLWQNWLFLTPLHFVKEPGQKSVTEPLSFHLAGGE